MNLFSADLLCFVMDQLQAQEGRLVLFRLSGKGGDPIPEPACTDIKDVLQQAKKLFLKDGLPTCAQAVDSATFYLERKGCDISSASQALNRLKSDVMGDLAIRQFLRVADDRPQCVDNKMAFGQAVFDAFPSARKDIEEAYNCMAAECSTAAVFHLMRAAEATLRALAFDRAVRIFPNKKTMVELHMDLANWDQIITELEEAESEIESHPRTLARQEQFDFYHGANIQFRAFKNVFRNSVMHSRESYDRDEANSLSHKVGEFMQILASKIREGEQTPRIWV